jgi:phosphatidylserine decarboxylase
MTTGTAERVRGFRVEFNGDEGRVVHPVDGRTVCVGVLRDGRWYGIEFVYEADQKCNRTRQAAMRAMQKFGR